MRWLYENARFGVLKSNNQKKEGIARIGFGAIGAISRLLPLSAPNQADRRWDAPAKIGNGGAARGCAGQNGTTPHRWIGGECARKRRDCGTTMRCAGLTKRMRRGDDIRRPNEKTKARR